MRWDELSFLWTELEKENWRRKEFCISRAKKEKNLTKPVRMKIMVSSESWAKIFWLNTFLPTWWAWLYEEDNHPLKENIFMVICNFILTQYA